MLYTARYKYIAELQNEKCVVELEGTHHRAEGASFQRLIVYDGDTVVASLPVEVWRREPLPLEPSPEELPLV